jgi:hypothetical protein
MTVKDQGQVRVNRHRCRAGDHVGSELKQLVGTSATTMSASSDEERLRNRAMSLVAP